jgi:cysteinyl-tRNA synthetase
MESLEQADIQVNRIYTALRDLPTYVSASQGEYTRRFYAAMDDDFNTPEALAVLQTLTREINSARDITKHRLAAEHGTELRTLAGLLGLGQLNPEKWFQSSGLASTSGKGESTSAPAANGSSGDNATLSNDEVQRLVDARAAARVARDWAESDRLRDALAAAGIIVEDKPGGKATWRRK